MDNQKEKAAAKKNKVIFAVLSSIAVIAVVAIGYVVLSKIKSNQIMSDDYSQEQFEGSPEISSNLQQECQQSANKLVSLKNYSDLEEEFKAHAANCREVYFSIDQETPFRKEGMYPDLAVDLAHQIYKSDKAKAHDILNYVKTLKPWEFYLGPVSCDSHHVVDAYLESLDLPEEKACIKLSEYKTKLLPDLQNKNFEVFKKMLANDDTVWMGQPESDVGCPEKISSVIQIVKKLTNGELSFEEPKQDSAEATDLVLSIKDNKQTEKVALVFKIENECLQIKSVLIPNLEVSE